MSDQDDRCPRCGFKPVFSFMENMWCTVCGFSIHGGEQQIHHPIQSGFHSIEFDTKYGKRWVRIEKHSEFMVIHFADGQYLTIDFGRGAANIHTGDAKELEKEAEEQERKYQEMAKKQEDDEEE